MDLNLKKKQLSILALLLVCVFCTSARAAVNEDPDFTYDIRSMIQMNPDFSTYADAGAPDGVIWLKRVRYDMAADGGIERQTMWILLGREGLPSKWLSWNVPAPKGGAAEILEASVYSPGEAVKIGTALLGSDGTVRSAVFSNLPEEFILVVHYREVFPGKLSVDDLVWTSESLPVWETVIDVTVPAGHPFYHFASQGVIPYEEKINDRTVYEWRVVNTAAEITPSIRAAGREYVVFGSRDDQRALGRFIKTAEDAPLPSSPQAVRDMFGGRDAAKVAENVLNWLYEQPRIVLTSEPRETPAEAPWTAREKTLIAHKWLKEAGVDSRLLWRLPYAPEDGKPVCESAAPVLEVSLPKSKTGPFHFDMEHQPLLEEDEFLSGVTVYGLQGANDILEERRPAVRKAAENNLTVRFDLAMDEGGMITGTARISARKAWRQFLFPEKPVSGDLDVLMKNMFTQVPRYGDVKFEESGAESAVTAALSGTQAIKGTEGSHIMLTPPPLVPQWFKSLSSGPFPYSLNFPFVMDVRIVLTLPASTANVILPSPVSMSAGKIRYSDSYKLENRRTRFVADAHMTVDTTLIADDGAAALNSAIQNWQTFMTRYLPVQLRPGA